MTRKLTETSFLVFTVAAVTTTLLFLLFSTSGRDDPYLTYWISKQLLLGSFNGYNHTPFEHTSALLHAVIVALASFVLKQSPIVAAKVLEFLATFATLIVTTHLLRPRFKDVVVIFPLLAIGSFPFFAYWSWGGLETSVVVLLCLLQTLYLSRHCYYACFVVNLSYSLLRPESIIVLPLQWILLNIYGHSYFRLYRLRFLFFALLPCILSVLLRLLIFGQPIPATVRAKSLWFIGYHDRILSGLNYLLTAGTGNPFIGVFTLILVFSSIYYLASLRSPWTIAIVTLAISQLIVVIISGGDWMEMSRFFVPPFTIILIAVLATFPYSFALSLFVLSLSSLFYFSTARSPILYSQLRLTPVSYFPILLTNRIARTPFWVTGHSYQESFFSCNRPFEWLNRPHFRDCVFLDAVLKAQSLRKYYFSPGDTLMSYQAGMIPFYLLQRYPYLRFIDPIGLGSPERTQISSLAFRGHIISRPHFDTYLRRFRPTFVVDLGGYHKLISSHGYRTVVQICVGSWTYPGDPGSCEALYVRADRYLAASSALADHNH